MTVENSQFLVESPWLNRSTGFFVHGSNGCSDPRVPSPSRSFWSKERQYGCQPGGPPPMSVVTGGLSSKSGDLLHGDVLIDDS